MRILDISVAVGFAISVSAYTLEITSCDLPEAGATDSEDEAPTFKFCGGGTYCDVVDVRSLPSISGIENDNFTIQIPVDVGYAPTTMEIERPTSAANWWCISSVVWEGEDNLLGKDGSLVLEAQTGSGGCINGLADPDSTYIEGQTVACKRTWRFFNVDASSNYVYDIFVRACSVSTYSSVQAYFCSHAACDGTIGEEVQVLLEMNHGDDRWTWTPFSSTFNPVAMRLELADEDWCADFFTVNLFVVFDGDQKATDFETIVNGVPAMIMHNIQANGRTTAQESAITPAPVATKTPEQPPTTTPEQAPTITPEQAPTTTLIAAETPVPTASTRASVATKTPAPAASANTDNSDSKWLDAAWEIAVTVIGAAVVGTIAAVGSFLCKCWPSQSRGISSQSTAQEAQLS